MSTTLTGTLRPDLLKLRTYALAGAFVAGNIALPQLAHLVPGGGPMLLPIYFFTLIAAYRYGLAAGLLTGALSPLVNYLLFAMPAGSMLPVILVKSSLLALAASYVSFRMKGAVSILALIGVVLAYQLPGAVVELLVTGSYSLAIQDFSVGLPGMVVQVVGGWIILKKLLIVNC